MEASTSGDSQKQLDILLGRLKGCLVVACIVWAMIGLLIVVWDQIDLERKVALYPPDEMKTGRALGVTLNDTAIEVIKRQTGKHPTFAFRSKRNNPITDINSHSWKESLKRAGIEDFTWHDLRHTWASRLV